MAQQQLGGGWPGWRSLLFIPADNHRLVEKAGRRGADAYILDLEDAVEPAMRASARETLPDMLAQLSAQGLDVLVRVNAGLRDLVRDLEACVRPGLRGVLVPKAESAEQLRAVDTLLTELERERDLPIGATAVMPLVETARGLLSCPELAQAAPRVIALAVGPEDLSLDLGGDPGVALLTEPCRQIAWACRAAGRMPVGFPGSIGNFTDLDRLRREFALARSLGFVSAMCVHPQQIEPCHEAFGVTDAELEWARRIAAGARTAEGASGSVQSVDGQMVDRPVLLRAQAVLDRWRRS